MRPLRTQGLALVAALLLGLAARASPTEEAVRVELNKLEPDGLGCRIYLVLENRSDSAFETLKLDLVMFDRDLVVAKRLAVETAPLPAGKLSLKVFDVDGVACDRVGRVLLNDVMACADGSGVRDDCLRLMSPASRSGTEFVK